MPLGNPITIENESRIVSVTTTTTDDTFTIQDGYRVNHINVYRNGVRLVDGTDFLARDGSTVQLIKPPVVGDVIEFQLYDDFKVPDAIVGSATSQIIHGDLVVAGTLYADVEVSETVVEYSEVAGIATYASTAGVSTSSGIASALTGDASVNTTGIITAASFFGDGSGLSDVVTGIQSGGTFVGTGATILNFVGAGNSISYNSGTNTIDINIAGSGGGGGSVTVDAGDFNSGSSIAGSNTEINGGDFN